MGSKIKFYAASRDESAAPAPGSNTVYIETQKRLLEETFAEFK
jgi:hypothetical protein